MKILIGCDPELFVQHRDSGDFISAWGLCQGTKHAPLPVEKGAVQVDGMALEFNIDPAECEDEFVNNIYTVLGEMSRYVPAGYKLTAVPTAEFSQEVWNHVPEAAKELGCDPDYNAYTGDVTPKPDGNRTFRTGAGHVHIGWTNIKDKYAPEHFHICCELIKAIDEAVQPFIKQHDPDKKRQELYGAPGCFRPKNYGVEYRSPSNFWVNDESFMRTIYDLCVSTTKKFFEENKMFREWYDEAAAG